MKKVLFILIVFSCIPLLSFKLWANVPAPPSNQQLGMPDSTDSYLEKTGNARGALKLTLRPNGYDWEFKPAEGYSFTDSGSLDF